MTTLVIRGKDAKGIRKLIAMAEELGLEITNLSDEQKEDLGLVKAIMEGRRTRIVSRETVMRNLRRA